MAAADLLYVGRRWVGWMEPIFSVVVVVVARRVVLRAPARAVVWVGVVLE